MICRQYDGYDEMGFKRTKIKSDDQVVDLSRYMLEVLKVGYVYPRVCMCDGCRQSTLPTYV